MRRIVNTTASFSLGRCVQLDEIFKYFPENAVRRTPTTTSKLDSIVYKEAKSKNSVTFLVYKTGKVVVAGAKGEKLAKNAAKRLVKVLTQNGCPNITCIYYALHNMVCVIELKRKLDLSTFAKSQPMKCSYNQELFAGVHYRPSGMSSKSVVTVHESGKAWATGIKSQQEFDEISQQFLVDSRGFLRDTDSSQSVYHEFCKPLDVATLEATPIEA